MNLHPAPQVTSFDCLNAVLSPIVITACSDRSISVVDVAHGTIARTLHDAHAKVRQDR